MKILSPASCRAAQFRKKDLGICLASNIDIVL